MADLDTRMGDVVAKVRSSFKSGRVHSYDQRIEFLEQVDRFVTEQEEAILSALHTDLRKNPNEALLTELRPCRSEIAYNLKNLRSWMALKPAARNLAFTATNDTAGIQAQPYGVVTLLCPWNYPVYLTLMPLIGAIAAGNCVIIKPSEVSVAVEKLFQSQLNNYLPADCFPVVCGGVAETTALLRQRVDYIFLTGSTQVGRLVMKAAAEHLTPVTLELGGKCPTFIDESSDMTTVASRLIGNKCLNAGQTCVSHDYILCTPETQDKFIAAAREVIKTFFGQHMQASKDFGRIINDRHFQRLAGLLERSTASVALENGSDRSDLYLGLTLLSDVKDSDAVMQEEVFGPILPIVTVASADEAVDFINAREKALAVYVFSKNDGVIQKFREHTSSGAIVGNDGLVYMSLPGLPFGGVGHSGLGAYHGRFSFETFSHQRAVLLRSQNMEFLNTRLRYPPFSAAPTVILTNLLFSSPRRSVFATLKIFFVAVLAYFGLAVISLKSA